MAAAKAAKEDVFDEDRLCRLVEMMKEHDLSEIDLEEDTQRIRLRRNTAPPVGVAPVYAAPAPNSATVQAPAAAAASPADDPNVVVIKSPMVGTFYTKPNPKSPPFVKVGDHVDPDKTICIIEAMKVFNEIPAETSGTIVAILAQDGDAVEFGKPLFKVDTKG
ncbi:MAG: acetyl-CoA carboxylase biotin carboxyl carrier protein [Planctomycetaceae bacterium]|nr:acetyl-CoA carboxylase biotin carboxyl carrier protein [Planctomycetales bacterium]MCB9872787.1 acetyl-CoA carboxylase biotin carboxyl carrier protein [Planctomycetaceae bacterium]MCB9926273.1 acetyl-CoA carboxylase biotin carboxyl carrier protein [Planctomycetaceae bacterium]